MDALAEVGQPGQVVRPDAVDMEEGGPAGQAVELLPSEAGLPALRSFGEGGTGPRRPAPRPRGLRAPSRRRRRAIRRRSAAASRRASSSLQRARRMSRFRPSMTRWPWRISLRRRSSSTASSRRTSRWRLKKRRPEPVSLEDVVLEADEEPRRARIALAAGPAAELVVDAQALVPVRADDVEAAQGRDLLPLLLARRRRA